MKTRLFSFFCCILAAANGWANNIQLAIPAARYCLIENPFDAAGGNTLLNVFGAQLQDGTVVYFWSCSDADPITNMVQFLETGTTYIYDSSINNDGPATSWWNADETIQINPNNILLNPGQGVFIMIPVAFMLNFNGAPKVPVLPAALPCGCGHYNLLGLQAAAAGTYQNITGLAPAEGAQVLTWNGAGLMPYTFSGGTWSPNAPVVPLGAAAFFFVPCCPAFPCPPDIVARSCTNIPVYYAPPAASSCGDVTVVCTPPSGSLFAPGTTTPVHCVATDTGGHSASCDFTVTVTGPEVTITHTITITWTGGGILQQADQLNGSWTDVPGGDVSPCILPAGAAARFYRVRCD
jgi:hypothetical protein